MRKKSMTKRILAAFLVLLLVGCEATGKKVEKAFIFSTSNTLSQEDAQETYDFFEKTVETGVREATPKDFNISGVFQIPIFFMINHKEMSFQFRLDSLMVVDEHHQITGKYIIEPDYYQNEFYPFISRLFDKYGPTYMQLLYGRNGLRVTLETDEGTRELNLLEIMETFDLGYLISTKYCVSDEFLGSLNDPRYVMRIDDGIVKETVYFVDNYAIINNRLIELPANIDLDSIFTEIHYDEDEVDGFFD